MHLLVQKLLYKFLALFWDIVLAIVSGPLLLFRIYKGKENKYRIFERFGIAKNISKNSIWLHAASVGETVALFPIIEFLNKENIILTTGTLTSARLISQYYPQITHEYAPIDSGFFLYLFLRRHNIKLYISCESEIWPRRISILTKKHIKQILVNATMSKRSYNIWRKFCSKKIFSKFNLVICQTEQAKKYYQALGSNNIVVTGNLKSAAKPLVLDRNLLAETQQALANKIIFAAISTHKGEEKICLDVFQQLKPKYPELFMILVPRHPERCIEIEKIIQYKYCRKTHMMNLSEQDILLGDTIGDMGYYLSLSNFCFIGKSLIEKGGHNPMEPILMSVPVISGIYVENFKSVYAELEQNSAVCMVNNAEELAQTVEELIISKQKCFDMINAALETVHKLQSSVEKTAILLKNYI